MSDLRSLCITPDFVFVTLACYAHLTYHREAPLMTITVFTSSQRRNCLPGSIMVDPYTEERNGHLYLVSQNKYQTAVLCDAIVDIQ
jgi:hypothetical protein